MAPLGGSLIKERNLISAVRDGLPPPLQQRFWGAHPGGDALCSHNEGRVCLEQARDGARLRSRRARAPPPPSKGHFARAAGQPASQLGGAWCRSGSLFVALPVVGPRRRGSRSLARRARGASVSRGSSGRSSPPGGTQRRPPPLPGPFLLAGGRKPKEPLPRYSPAGGQEGGGGGKAAAGGAAGAAGGGGRRGAAGTATWRSWGWAGALPGRQ